MLRFLRLENPSVQNRGRGIKCILPLNGIRCLRNSIRSSLSRSLALSLFEDLRRPGFRILSPLVTYSPGFSLCHTTTACLGLAIMSCHCFVSVGPDPFLAGITEWKIPLAIAPQRERMVVASRCSFCLGITASIRSIIALSNLT